MSSSAPQQEPKTVVEPVSETVKLIQKPKIILGITDPFDCKKGIFGKVEYSGAISDLEDVLVTVSKDGESTNYKAKLNEQKEYAIVEKFQKGDYKVNFSVKDKLGNNAEGEYEFVNEVDCQDVNSTYQLARTGGSEYNNSFSFYLVLLWVLQILISTYNEFIMKK